MPSSKLVAGLEAGLDAAIDAQLGIGVAEELDASRRSRRLLGGPPHAMRSTFGGELRNLTIPKNLILSLIETSCKVESLRRCRGCMHVTKDRPMHCGPTGADVPRVAASNELGNRFQLHLHVHAHAHAHVTCACTT